MSFKLQSKIAALTAQLRRKARALVKRTAFGIEADIKVSMAEPKHGRTYKRKGREHQASAPGEAPAVDYGALVNSIETVIEDDLHATVGTNQEQASVLEFGGAKVEPRPFLGPAFEKAAPEFEKGLKELIK